MAFYECIDKILIINLSYRQDRWEHIQEEFVRVGIPNSKYERFEAIPAYPQFMGCTQSHLACLQLARERDYKNILILEDDFTIYDVQHFRDSVAKIPHLPMVWDVLFFGVNILHKNTYNEYLDKIVDAQAPSGYLVNRHYYDTLIENYQSCLQRGDFLDLHFKILQPHDHWYAFQPKLGYQYASFSNNLGIFVDYGC